MPTAPPVETSPRAATHTLASWDVWTTSATLAMTAPGALGPARVAVESVLDAVDRAASRFRPDSELNRLSRRAGQWQPLSPLLADLLAAALRAARLTDGAVDPTVGGQLVSLGYDRSFPTLDADGPPVNPICRATSWRSIELDCDAGLIRLPAGMTLDLGATAKAWAADRAAATAARAVGGGVLVSLGGDIAVAGPPPTGGWVVAIADEHAAHGPTGQGDPSPRVTLAGGGLATSSTVTRRWRRGDRWVHHLVDPMTGLPTSGPWRTVSVAAATCLDANTASTAAIVRGKGAERWLAERRLPARLVGTDGSVRLVGGWPAEGPA
ncbi:MAG TPA: FAD:protein FMN transferase [Mycobacteriales bacterium]|nr:FAD:protein FMN transferase [Mycobacteriales bacterium]